MFYCCVLQTSHTPENTDTCNKTPVSQFDSAGILCCGDGTALFVCSLITGCTFKEPYPTSLDRTAATFRCSEVMTLSVNQSVEAGQATAHFC